ncbi:DUF1488 domain-containing protein [Shewanella violacea]|uniref:Uncharacterized protein n=1 Tax=Shewanella violacea (strain JCM 10179 / CIP 106290 / LMG 19151 / DSS12) TaxID=637905 RepID=D4ZAW5_SHEVD|nr:conserved hypothetical protein [Shewanella violacea DSS12]
MRYQVEISKENKLLFKVEIENINKKDRDDALEILLNRFPLNAGYQRHVLYSDSETRYLKMTNKSIEILAAQPIFKSMGLR